MSAQRLDCASWLPARGTIVGSDAPVTTPCGQYDLGGGTLSPQASPDHPMPRDWETATRAVPGGQLGLLVSCRSDRGLAGLARAWRLAVRLATWSTWPGDFGQQSNPAGPGSRLTWGPELVNRLATTGSCAIDLSDWAVGGRFVAVALTAWPLQQDAPPVAFDWQLTDARSSVLCPTDIWPTTTRTGEVPQVSLPPTGPLPDDARVGQVGMVRGWRPRLAAATNHHSDAVSLAAAARFGAARQRVGAVVKLLPGESRVIARLDEHDPATGLELFASANGPGAHLTLDFA